MSFTVKATQTGATNNGTTLQVKVLTGAVEAGGAGATNMGTGAISASITPNASNSLIGFGLVDVTGANAFTLASNETSWNNDQDSTDGFTGQQGFYSGTVTAGTPVTVGATAPTADDTGYAIYEVKPSGGSTPAVDASSPAAVNATATSATTAAFTPPGGSVLVAIVACNGTGAGGTTMTITDTSGLGLVWTQRQGSGPGGGVWFFTATMPSSALTVLPSGMPWQSPLAGQFGPNRPWAQAQPIVAFPQPASVPGLPPYVPPLRRIPRIQPGTTARTPVPGPGAVSQPLPVLQPQLPRRSWVLFRRPAQHPVTGLGGISQPLPAIQPMLPRKLRWYPRSRLSAQVPGPGAVSQPLPAIEPQRPRRVLPPPRRRLSNQPVPTGAVFQPLPARQQPPPKRLAWRPGRRLLAQVPSAQAPAISPPPARARPQRWLRRQAPAAPAVPAVVTPAAPAPTAGRSRRALRGPRARVAPSVPGPTVAAIVTPPAPAGGRTARFMLFARRRQNAQRPSGGVSQPLPALHQPARRLLPRRAQRAQQAPAEAGLPVPAQAQAPPRRLLPRRAVQRPAPPAVIPLAKPAPISYRRRVWQWFLRKRRGDVVPGPTTVPPSHPAGVWEAGGREDRWQLFPLRAQWSARRTPSRWHILPLPERWKAHPTAGRWRLVAGDFDPIAAVSQENVPVTWTSDLAGTQIVPDGSSGNAVMPVQFAFPVSSGNTSAPAEPSTWYPASWLPGQTSKGFVAQCPVGPSTTGPTLTAGQKYDVWSQVNTGTNATVMKFAGVLTVY